VDAVLAHASQIIGTHRARIAALTAQSRLPTMGGPTGWVEAGGLMSYGARDIDRKRSQGYHRGTNFAQSGSKTDRAHIAVGALVIAAYRITSSAWKRTTGGMVSPRAWAVLRLMINWNLVGCSTGRSAGLAPLRILSTKMAARPHASVRLGP